jgi:hypothetical protein
MSLVVDRAALWLADVAVGASSGCRKLIPTTFERMSSSLFASALQLQTMAPLLRHQSVSVHGILNSCLQAKSSTTLKYRSSSALSASGCFTSYTILL